MALLRVVATVALGVTALIIVTSVLVFDRERLALARRELRERAIVTVPFLALLGLVLGFNARFRNVIHELSWMVGIRLDLYIVALEGHTVAYFQYWFSDEVTAFFSYMYVFGYVFLLVFPLIAYFLLSRMDTFKALTVAYAANYMIGLVCYIVFVALGPRNHIDGITEGMYIAYPQFQLLTSEVNQYSNVFPSLHASLSATVMLFAWRTRETYPIWMVIAMFVGTSVIISTMYLAIHWIVDVIAGIALAGIAYWIGVRAVEKQWLDWTDPRVLWARVARSGR